MILDTNKIEEKALANFKGGEKALNARMHVDENNKIIFGRLEPGASIGEHTHETNSEIIFFTSGKGKVIYDGKEERVEAGLCEPFFTKYYPTTLYTLAEYAGSEIDT